MSSTDKRLRALEELVRDLPNRVRVDVHRTVTHECEDPYVDDGPDEEAVREKVEDELEATIQRAFERATGYRSDWFRENTEPWCSLARTLWPKDVRLTIANSHLRRRAS